MLLHLPIVILATLSPFAISDAIPKFDIAKECRFESETPGVFERCSREEADALQQIGKEWGEFVAADRKTCFTEATIGGPASYVELQICLEMARDARKGETNGAGVREAQSPRPVTPEVSVLDKHE